MRPYPDWPFAEEANPSLIASYQEAVMSGNLTQEGSLKDVLLKLGVSPEDMAHVQRDIVEQMSFVIFYYQDWYYRRPVCETSDRERMFRVIQGNEHQPFRKYTKAKKVKESPIVDLNYWGAAKAVKAKPARVTPVRQHPDGYDLVNIAKSAAIHYAKPGGKKTLCGKVSQQAVKDEHKMDLLYPVCAKCLAKTQ